MSKQKKTVLVADDNDGIVASLTTALQYGGYEVTSIMNGEKVKKIHAPFSDLILLDIWMAGVNGLDVCRYLKAKLETKNIPIIMISAYLVRLSRHLKLEQTALWKNRTPCRICWPLSKNILPKYRNE